MSQLLAFADGTTVAEKTTERVTETVTGSWDAVRESFENAWHSTIEWAPQVLAMIVVIVAGYVIMSKIAAIEV